MTEQLCFACSALAEDLRAALRLNGLDAGAVEARMSDIIDHNRPLRACGALSLVLATDEYLPCMLLDEHDGEHSVRMPVGTAVRLLTLANVAEQLAGAIETGDSHAAALAVDLLHDLFMPDGPTNGMLR